MKQLKDTYDFGRFGYVTTRNLNSEFAFLEFVDLATSKRDFLRIELKYYKKTFLINVINAWIVGSSINKISANLNKYLIKIA